jgi:hypothetical protein
VAKLTASAAAIRSKMSWIFATRGPLSTAAPSSAG